MTRIKDKHEAISHCVMCGSKRIEVQRVEKRIKGRPAVAVEAEVCLNCGERYYARQAVEAILNAGKK